MEPLLSKSEFTNSRKLRNLLGLSAVYGCFFVLFNWSPGVTSARLPNKNCYYIMWFSTTRMYINSVLNIFTGFQMTTLRHWKAYKNTIWNAICHLFFFLEIDISHNFTLVSFFPLPTPGSNLSSYNCCYHKSSTGEEEEKLGVAFYQRGSGSWGVVWLS